MDEMDTDMGPYGTDGPHIGLLTDMRSSSRLLWLRRRPVWPFPLALVLPVSLLFLLCVWQQRVKDLAHALPNHVNSCC